MYVITGITNIHVLLKVLLLILLRFLFEVSPKQISLLPFEGNSSLGRLDWELGLEEAGRLDVDKGKLITSVS